MDSQLKKGIIEMCVLKCISNSPSYGYEIMTDVSIYTSITESTLYTILHRLKNQGYLTTYTEEHDGRLRKYYEITSEGVNKLNEFIGGNAKMQKILNYIIGGKK